MVKYQNAVKEIVKKGKIIAIASVAIVLGILASVSSSMTGNESINLDMSRTSGTINTAMGSPLLGSQSAPITIVEFGDYQCPNCKAWFETTKPALIENYINSGKVNLVYLDLVILGRDSFPAAEASYCAEDQGKYWEYHGLLFSSQTGIDDGWANSERLRAFAFHLELDMDLFNSCLDSGKYKQRVQFNIKESNKSGARATPTFFVINSNGDQQKIVGPQPYSVFKNVIDSMI